MRAHYDQIAVQRFCPLQYLLGRVGLADLDRADLLAEFTIVSIQLLPDVFESFLQRLLGAADPFRDKFIATFEIPQIDFEGADRILRQFFRDVQHVHCGAGLIGQVQRVTTGERRVLGQVGAVKMGIWPSSIAVTSISRTRTCSVLLLSGCK